MMSLSLVVSLIVYDDVCLSSTVLYILLYTPPPQQQIVFPGFSVSVFCFRLPRMFCAVWAKVGVYDVGIAGCVVDSIRVMMCVCLQQYFIYMIVSTTSTTTNCFPRFFCFGFLFSPSSLVLCRVGKGRLGRCRHRRFCL